MTTPLIFDIARGSFEDGPGVRTVVFFKGCPLRCTWCHNPESHLLDEETFFFEERCIGCGDCKKNGACVAGARQKVGRYYPPTELVEEVLRDKSYFDSSEGGVTFSGGEPLLFIDYLAEVLPLLKKAGVHVTIQTCGHFDFEAMAAQILHHVDLWQFDLKIFDASQHQRLTGKSNETILENFQRLRKMNAMVVPRIPLVPHCIATEENLACLAEFLVKLQIKQVELLPYHSGGAIKCIRLGQKTQSADMKIEFDAPEQQRLISLFKSYLAGTKTGVPF